MDEMHFRTLAHDMRAPLGAIAALSQLAFAHAEDAQAVRGYMQRLDAACAQLTAMAGQLLDADSAPEIVLSTPREIAARAAALYAGRVETAFSGNCAQKIAVDETAVQRILGNLLGNAVKYTPKGGRIALNVCADADAVRFAVLDEGVGMGEATMARLFLPCMRGKEARDKPGTGLGLFAAHTLAKKMGGEIAAQSRPGEGSVFTFTLPPAEPKRVLAGKRLLVAEDSELALDALCELLEENGAQAVRAGDGETAVRLFAQGGFDAVLMDLLMPGMDGCAAARAMRQLERGRARRVPIIALTGAQGRQARQSARASGMDMHAAKPVNMQVLARMLSCFRENGHGED